MRGDGDVVAGMNLRARVNDPEIRLGTPKERAKVIPEERFRRRKQTLLGTPLPAGLAPRWVLWLGGMAGG